LFVSQNLRRLFAKHRTYQYCGSGMFYPGSDPFFIPDPRSKHFFIPCHGSYMKSRIQTYFFSCFLCLQGQSLSHKSIRSGIRKKFIPDLGAKKAPDHGSGSASLKRIITILLAPVLRIRIRDPVLFYPPDPGSGSGIRDGAMVGSGSGIS
jgi:hypothetical protein